ncbi:uncharacterized protein LOC110837306 [Zootermopsis nevadensis]|uniref:DUF4774 domain-containing protein n=1 Tax=Zootermopsis nevadensis TaxID=136037 RepID=A0A067R0X7_ZOONE|nr:uncharacterized protein LOC110837306 [Zootermopsis nevadensis]KDR11174.1 hypothetical protein L798_14682 [Zootermopsis nevadensis]
MHRDISPFLRHATTPLSLHPPNSWFDHLPADGHRLGPNSYLTEHPSFSSGLPLIKMSPPASNIFMIFNGRLSSLKPTIKKIKDRGTGLAITPGMYNTRPLLNSLSYGKLHLMQSALEENNSVQNSALLQSGPSPNRDTETDNLGGILKNKMEIISPTEIQNHIDPAVAPQITSQLLTEVILNVNGKTFDTKPITVTNVQACEEQRAVESESEKGEDDGNANLPKKPTTLVLQPAAKAVAGAKGIAIAAPISHAVVKKGQEVNIHFDPYAVAVVGPGGFADAHSDLVITHLEDRRSQKKEKLLV